MTKYYLRISKALFITCQSWYEDDTWSVASDKYKSSKPVEISKAAFRALWSFHQDTYPPGDKENQWTPVADLSENDRLLEIKAVKE